jgi:putative transposase
MELTYSYHSVYSINYHLVIVVAYRKKVLTPTILSRCLEVATDIATMFNASITEANGEEDHIHILLSAPPDFNPCRFINSLKTVTSRRIRSEFPEIRQKLWKDKFWAASYFIVTVGGAPLETIKQYIKNQRS